MNQKKDIEEFTGLQRALYGESSTSKVFDGE